MPSTSPARSGSWLRPCLPASASFTGSRPARRNECHAQRVAFHAPATTAALISTFATTAIGRITLGAL